MLILLTASIDHRIRRFVMHAVAMHVQEIVENMLYRLAASIRFFCVVQLLWMKWMNLLVEKDRLQIAYFLQHMFVVL